MSKQGRYHRALVLEETPAAAWMRSIQATPFSYCQDCDRLFSPRQLWVDPYDDEPRWRCNICMRAGVGYRPLGLEAVCLERYLVEDPFREVW